MKHKKRTIAEYPYDNYYLYIVFHKGENRNYANLIPIDKSRGLKRKTISYARYLVSVKEKRILSKTEHVDHKDNDKTNDDIDNLQILTLSENNKKEAKRHGKKYVMLKCPNCNRIFEREKRQTHLQKKKNRYTACGRTCSSTFGAKLQHYPDDNMLQKALAENIIMEFTKYNE